MLLRWLTLIMSFEDIFPRLNESWGGYPLFNHPLEGYNYLEVACPKLTES